MTVFGLEPWILAYAAVAMFIGGFIRGYTGFGSSMFWVASVSLVVPPIEIVPTVYLLEIMASIHLLPRVWREVHWPSVAWLLLGALIATPAGVWLLAVAPADTMRIVISVLILVAVAVLMRNPGLGRMPGPVPTALTGALSGVINGATSMGGPPAVVYYLSTPLSAAAGRACLIAYLLGTDIFSAGIAGGAGLIDGDILLRSLGFFVIVLAGLAVGHRRFVLAPPETFRRFTMILLAALALVGLVRAALT
ncbi:MAG: sulfite exporter TauE/SafE family protein [Proteobacteria bacterium]|nr:sulfite exporter TauE/SafE family protein [Pseudomonadota bacterium]